MNHLTHDPQFLKNDKRLLPPGGSTFNQTNDQAAQLYPHEFTLSFANEPPIADEFTLSIKLIYSEIQLLQQSLAPDQRYSQCSDTTALVGA